MSRHEVADIADGCAGNPRRAVGQEEGKIQHTRVLGSVLPDGRFGSAYVRFGVVNLVPVIKVRRA